MKEFIANAALRGRIASPAEAARHIANGMTVAMGGYSLAGYPKAIARELVRRKQGGEPLRLHLVTGANVGQLDEMLAGADIIARRTPMCANKTLASQINDGRVHYVEQQMNKMPGLLRRAAFGKLDVAVVEALGITAEGFFIPTSSVGMVNHLVEHAEKVIIEINTAQPRELEGMHDVYTIKPPPERRPIPLTDVAERIGEPFVRVNPDKVVAVVESTEPDLTGRPAIGNAVTNAIAANLFDLLDVERNAAWGGKLPPLQTGFGGIAASLAAAFGASSFSDIRFFCGGVGEAVLNLVIQGKVSAVSTGGIEMSDGTREAFRNHGALLRERCVIRSGDITNCAETIGRMGIVALNTAIEIDIYGNVNSSHIGGNRVVNGIGGGANFAQNAELSVLLLPSTGKGGAISTIVPMVFHQDICEHDIDVVVTENGLADLRGLDEVERAKAIIANCAAEPYRAQLTAYLERAIREAGGHRPQLPAEAYAWYTRLKETGSMRE